jgi:hypothetical protein
MEGVTVREVSPNNNLLQERPTGNGRDDLDCMDNMQSYGLNGHKITKSVITNISPIDTWFMSNSGNGKARQRYHEWQLDTLATPTANAQIEGDTKSATAITATTRTGNYCQNLSKEFLITEDEELVDKAGRVSEISYQTQKKMKELARDIEYALLLNASAVSGATSIARQLKGFVGWVTTNTYTGTATGNANSLTATNIRSTLQKVWAQGGSPQHLLCGGFQKSAISSMTTSNTKFVDAPKKMAIDSVDVYDTDFGRVAIHLSHILDGTSNTTKGYVLVFGDMSLWQKAWLKPVKKTQLPIAALASFFTIEASVTLESRQEAGAGIMSNLTVA